MFYKNYLLLFNDIAVFVFSLILALIMRNRSIPANNYLAIHFYYFLPILICWFLVFYAVGFYNPGFYKTKTAFLTKSVRVFTFNLLLAVIYFYLFPGGINPKTILALFGSLFFLTFIYSRTKLTALFRREDFRAKTVFIGREKFWKEVISVFDQNPTIPFSLDYFFSKNVTKKVNKIQIIKDIAEALKKQKIEAVIWDHGFDDRLLRKEIMDSFSFRLEFFTLVEFYQFAARRVPISLIDEFWLIKELSSGEKNTIYEFVKRFIDLLLSALLIIVSAPFLISIAVLVRIDSAGPIFFRQKRVGLNGKNFRVIKFRTMNKNTDEIAVWAKIEDSRITRIGRYLRKTHLDELPQLFNVFWGTMSFVGPRPEQPEFVAKLEKEIPFYKIRHLTKPGITGWAQIIYPYSDSVKSAKEKLEYELYYLKNRSLLLDLKIIIKTAYQIVKADGR